MKRLFFIFIGVAITILIGCKKHNQGTVHYFQMSLLPSKLEGGGIDWRDTAYVIAVSDPVVLSAIYADIKKPLTEHQLVLGDLAPGDGGFNHNANFRFNWHYKPGSIALVDHTAEIYDGLPFTDVNQHPGYWIDTMKRFSCWSAYISREIK